MCRLNMNTSLSMALSLAGPPIMPPEGASSERPPPSRGNTLSHSNAAFTPNKEILYKGVSNRPRGWKPRRNSNVTPSRSPPHSGLKKFDGVARKSFDWDDLRRDPELWFTNGNCLVHLYAEGQSKRGPSFKVPFKALIEAQCEPLLAKFLSRSNYVKSSYFETDRGDSGWYELYIPVPATLERSQVMQYHVATRNMFAWIFKKSLVGSQLGTSLVQLLNSMNEFRSEGTDSIADIVEFIGDAGYAEMRNLPDHALAILHFAEHFHFRDLYIDSFAHCVGMNEILLESPEFELASHESRVLIRCARVEMDDRLSRYGNILGAFLEDELSAKILGISAGSRAHLERFRSFVQTYYVSKLGYYPPTSMDRKSKAFPKEVFAIMHADFQELYEYLVDKNFTAGSSLGSPEGGLCVFQTVQTFDARNHYKPLDNPMPLLPEAITDLSSRRISRISWFNRNDKLKPDPRLITISNLAKATNRQRADLFDSPMVRAYRSFEKECVFSISKNDIASQVSAIDARKVCWLLIYTMLQTLRSATFVPPEVRDSQNVAYDLCILTAGCPPWMDENSQVVLPYAQKEPNQQDEVSPPRKTSSKSVPVSPWSEKQPDIDYRPSTSRKISLFSIPEIPKYAASRSTVRRAVSMPSNVPELKHPRPHRISFHEILVHGYGNGLNSVPIIARPVSANDADSQQSNKSNELTSPELSETEFPSHWSNSDSDHGSSPASSISEGAVSHGQDTNALDLSNATTQNSLEKTDVTLLRQASCVYGQGCEDTPSLHLIPEPLSVKKNVNNGENTLITNYTLKHETTDAMFYDTNPELSAYLSSS